MRWALAAVPLLALAAGFHVRSNPLSVEATSSEWLIVSGAALLGGLLVVLLADNLLAATRLFRLVIDHIAARRPSRTDARRSEPQPASARAGRQ